MYAPLSTSQIFKVAEHNKVVERTYKLEGQMLEVQHDIRDLKNL